MIFDLLSLFTIVGLLVRGLKKGASKLSLFVAIGISALVSGALIPVYMKFLNLPKDIPAGVIAFLITFIFAYVIISVPTLIFSVVILGSLIIIIYAVLIALFPANIQNMIMRNSKIYPVIAPLINSILEMIRIGRGTANG